MPYVNAAVHSQDILPKSRIQLAPTHGTTVALICSYGFSFVK